MDSSSSENFMGRVCKVGDCTGCVNIHVCKLLLAGGHPVSPHHAAVAADQVSYPKNVHLPVPQLPCCILGAGIGTHVCRTF